MVDFYLDGCFLLQSLSVAANCYIACAYSQELIPLDQLESWNPVAQITFYWMFVIMFMISSLFIVYPIFERQLNYDYFLVWAYLIIMSIAFILFGKLIK